jgi:hypothetical protein
MDARTILATLATATIPPTWDMEPIPGASDGHRAILANPADPADTVTVAVKRAAWHGSPEAEVFAFAVSSATPGLVDVPATVLREDAEGHTVSVQEWRTGGHPLTDLATVLQSDKVGMAAFDWIIANRDRRQPNALVIPSGHYHHDRLVAIDNGAAFGTLRGAGELSSSRSDNPKVAMATLRVPHYIHDHASRIVAAASILTRTADILGYPEWAVDTLDRAEEWCRMDRFPVPTGRGW